MEENPAETVSQNFLTRKSDLSTLRITELAERCEREINAYRGGELETDAYSVELLRRVTMEEDQAAWISLQQCLSTIVQDWLYQHPQWEKASHLDSAENYTAQSFKRFWQVTTQRQHVECTTLAIALQYLYASLNGALLDTLRSSSWPREIPPSERNSIGELETGNKSDRNDVWEHFQSILPSIREQRLAYLLFHCGLKPTEIVRLYPQEGYSVHEIYHVGHTIMVQTDQS